MKWLALALFVVGVAMLTRALRRPANPDSGWFLVNIAFGLGGAVFVVAACIVFGIAIMVAI